MDLTQFFPKQAGVKSLDIEIIFDGFGSTTSVTENSISDQPSDAFEITLYAYPW